MNENELIEQAAEVDLTDRTEVLAQWVAVLDKLTEKAEQRQASERAAERG